MDQREASGLLHALQLQRAEGPAARRERAPSLEHAQRWLPNLGALRPAGAWGLGGEAPGLGATRDDVAELFPVPFEAHEELPARPTAAARGPDGGAAGQGQAEAQDQPPAIGQRP